MSKTFFFHPSENQQIADLVIDNDKNAVTPDFDHIWRTCFPFHPKEKVIEKYAEFENLLVRPPLEITSDQQMLIENLALRDKHDPCINFNKLQKQHFKGYHLLL